MDEDETRGSARPRVLSPPRCDARVASWRKRSADRQDVGADVRGARNAGPCARVVRAEDPQGTRAVLAHAGRADRAVSVMGQRAKMSDRARRPFSGYGVPPDDERIALAEAHAILAEN